MGPKPPADGDFVDLRAEMDLLVALSNCPHPLDPGADLRAGRAVDRALSRGPRRSRRSLPHGDRRSRSRAFENNALLAGSRRRSDHERFITVPSLHALVCRHEIIPADAPWSVVIRKGQTLRIVDSHGQQAVDTLFYRADDFAERYSAQDTLRAQGSAYVGIGTPHHLQRGATSC